jgi:hypothetical protein
MMIKVNSGIVCIFGKGKADSLLDIIDYSN